MYLDSSAPTDAKGTAIDLLGRAPRDLRISVTDRCNFRCGYCLPRDKIDASAFLPRAEILDFEEIVRLSRQFVALGTQKIRLTGGEPLLRRKLPQLVEQLASLNVELALTTNGVLLPKLARDLRQAGLDRITVSLDALDDECFQQSCDAPGFTPADVLLGIEAACEAGFERIKINCVVRRGQNEQQILPLVRHFSGRDVVLRFIEYMDVGTLNDWDPSRVFSKDEIVSVLESEGELVRLEKTTPGEVALRYAGKHGEIGIIASVTEPFCSSCCRARLSADGKIYSCLFAQSGLDLKARLRAGHSDFEIEQAIREFWSGRSDRYSEVRRERFMSRDAQQGDDQKRVHLPTLRSRVEMSYIGG